MNFKIPKVCFLKKQADLKANCTKLWRFVLMITYNMLTQKNIISVNGLRVFSK